MDQTKFNAIFSLLGCDLIFTAMACLKAVEGPEMLTLWPHNDRG